MPPSSNMYGTLPNHSRTPSDPMASGFHTLTYSHKRSPSGDSTSGRSGKMKFMICKLLLMLIFVAGINVKRPIIPPPPAPNLRLDNGNCELESMSVTNPVPPPRKVRNSFFL